MKPEKTLNALGSMDSVSARKSEPDSTASSKVSASELHPLEKLSMMPGPMMGDLNQDPATMPVRPSFPSSAELKRQVVDSLLRDGLAKTREEAVQMFEDEWGK